MDDRTCLAYAKVADGRDVPFVFRSYDHLRTYPYDPLERNPGYAHKIPIWQVARATTAAPTYFDTMEIYDRTFGDGGFGCNNPSWEAYQEVVFMNSGKSNSVALLLSIGTGKSKIVKYASKKWSQLYTFIRAAKQMASDSEDTHEKTSSLSKHGEGFPYYRFNVAKGLSDMKMDEWKKARRGKPSTLEQITVSTQAYLDGYIDDDKSISVRARLEEVAEKLVLARRQRAATPQWEAIAQGVRYYCRYPGCNKPQKERETRLDLWRHLTETHNLPGPGSNAEDVPREVSDWIQRGRIEPFES